MSEPTFLKIGGVAAVLAAIVCCVGLLLIAALASLSFTAWLANAYYVVIPALFIGLGLGGLWLYRLRFSAQACCDPVAHNKAPNHE